jgi:hypothetical protein
VEGKRIPFRFGWLIIALGAAFLLSLMACSGKSAQEQLAEKALEKATGKKAEVDLQQRKVTVKTGDGQSEISSGPGTWPTDLPADVPPFVQGKVKAVTRATVEGKQSWNVTLEALEPGALQNYSKILEAKGWKSMQSMTAAEGGMFQATKGSLMIIAMFNEKEKTASIGVGS